MTAYVIVDIEVHDPVGYEEYKKLAPAVVEMYGGKYIARGGKTETLEGDWAPKRLVILQFESSQQAKKWWDSDEYREARTMRQKTTNSQMVVIEGV
jgi:uncharacterized protein (DUF1330 family)